MSWRNPAGALVCAVLFAGAFLTAEGGKYYWNAAGLAIVLSGTLGAALLSHPLEALRAAFRVAWNSYRVSPVTPGVVVEALMDIALRSRHDGLLALERLEREMEVSFLRSALELLVDGYDEREMRDVLQIEIDFFEKRRLQHERVFRNMAQLAPAFGVAGSVVGLVGLLVGLGDTAVILRSIPLALTSTLYGVVLANFCFTPVAESIHAKTERELLLQRLIVEGVAAVQQERNPSRLERRLLSFLTPSARPGNQRSFAQIRRKYRKLQRERREAPPAAAAVPGAAPLPPPDA